MTDKEMLEKKMNLIKANLEFFQEVSEEDKSYILGYLAGLVKASKITKTS